MLTQWEMIGATKWQHTDMKNVGRVKIEEEYPNKEFLELQKSLKKDPVIKQ